jgi:hypothetical protein
MWSITASTPGPSMPPVKTPTTSVSARMVSGSPLATSTVTVLGTVATSGCVRVRRHMSPDVVRCCRDPGSANLAVVRLRREGKD